MKPGLLLLLTLLLFAGCASQEPVDDSATAPQRESVYAASLPATDMGASRNDGPDEPMASSAPANRNYASEPGLDRDVLISQPSSAPAPAAPEVEISEADPDSGDPASAIDLYNSFTLQLAALPSREAAIAYAQQYEIDQEAAGVARILSNGEIYYILAYGVYATENQAQLASQELQQLGVPEPWIRLLATLERLSQEADAAQPEE